MNEQLLKEMNSNIRHLLLVMTLGTLPEETKYSSLKNMGFTSVEISDFTGVPESTIKRWWSSVKATGGKNGRSK